MQSVTWSLRYIMLLVRKSYLVPLLAGIQVYTILGTSQGRDVSAAMIAEPGYWFPTLVYQFGVLLSGLLYWTGAYWLLFFF